MKKYDSIPAYNHQFEKLYNNTTIFAFDKLDGSNIRVEYSEKKGFYKFGSREVLLDETSSDLGFCIELFHNTWKPILEEKIKKYSNILKDKTTFFFELVGTKSKFGFHNIGHDNFQLVLIDVSPFKNTYIPPDVFYEMFYDCNIPKLIYNGVITKEFVNDIIENKYDLSEGVIIKGLICNKKGNNRLIYTKIKTNKWFEELKRKKEYLYKLEYYEHIIKQKSLNKI